ncbi:SMEK domain-containing protein [Flavobacterium sp. FlaQc-51]|uniref:SMEK domain-containing protein n=1 Tax=Flavobacterium sp. FlaQc-51 TaxID=3374184 RepID=UPI003757B6FE
MSNQKREISEIRKHIISWIYDIDVENARSYFDINKVSEGISLRLLNLIYGFNLKDLNDERMNFPGIDLGDADMAKIAFQITSDNDVRKIRDTLKTFKESGFDKRFTNGVKFLILRTRKKRFSKIEGYDDIFDISKDVWYPSDLIREIESIFYDDPERFFKIKDFLALEFGSGNKKEMPLSPDQRRKIKNFIAASQKKLPSEDKIVYQYLGEDEVLYDALEIFKLPFHSGGRIILGKSGCGKSMLAGAWSLYRCGEMVPLLLEAKYFETGLIEMMDNEVKKSGFKSSSDFISACGDQQKKILLVLDGLNECDDAQAEILVSELTELSSRHDVLFIITAQELSQSLVNLNAGIIKMQLPDIGLKKAIAAKYSDYPDKLIPVLANVSTALEAKMVGEIGKFDADKNSRSGLFELYMRKKLGGHESYGMLLLCRTAYWMSREITFSVSLRQLDLILQDNNIPQAVLQHCLKEGILVTVSNRLSFVHEMIYDFFTAEAIVRFNREPAQLIEEFKAPRNHDKKLLVIGSLNDDPVARNTLLEEVTDYELLLDILKGEAGEYCRIWAEGRLGSIIEKMRLEARNISFALTGNSDFPVTVVPESIASWKENEVPFFQVLGFRLRSGEHLKEVFAVIEIIDDRRNEYYKQLLEEASIRKINLRNGLFAAVFTASHYFVDMSGIGYILSVFNSGIYAFNSKNELSAEQIRELVSPKITFGQFYFLLKLFRFSANRTELYSTVCNALKVWKSMPYQLKLEVLMMVPFCPADEEQRLALVEILNKIHGETENIWLSTAVFDTLQDLGALEEDALAHKDTVASQISELMQEPYNEEYWQGAYQLYVAQFDHPYSSAYFQTVEDLDHETKKIFFTMALRHRPDDTLFSSGLIFECEELLGEQCCSYLDHFLLDPCSGSEPSYDAVKTCLAVLLVLAKYRRELPSSQYKLQNLEGRNIDLLSAGTILYYWINRKDLPQEEIRKKCMPVFEEIFTAEPIYLVYVFKELEFSFYQLHFPAGLQESISVKGIDDFFSDLLLDSWRKAYSHPAPDRRFRFTRTGDLQSYAVDKIGLYGSAADIPELLKAVAHPILGKSALAAIRRIKERL